MLKPIGFWSYSATDDEYSRGRLSQLRALLAAELQQKIGRRLKVNIFQDVAAIPPGAEWEKQIRRTPKNSSFLIPIVTPASLQSEWCCREINMFREREATTLWRADLIFPLHYTSIDELILSRPDDCYDPQVFNFLRSRQWIDFRDVRLKNPESEVVAMRIERMANAICSSLRRDDAPMEENGSQLEVLGDQPVAEAKPAEERLRQKQAEQRRQAETQGPTEAETSEIEANPQAERRLKAPSDRNQADANEVQQRRQVGRRVSVELRRAFVELRVALLVAGSAIGLLIGFSYLAILSEPTPLSFVGTSLPETWGAATNCAIFTRVLDGKGKGLAILVSDSHDYDDQAQVLNKYAEHFELSVVSNIRYPDNISDFKSYVSAIAKARPRRIVFCPSSAAQAFFEQAVNAHLITP